MHSEDAGVQHPDGSYDLIYTEEELCEDLRGEHASCIPIPQSLLSHSEQIPN